MNTNNPSQQTPKTGMAAQQPGCSILATIDLIGDRWTLGILRSVIYGFRRFSDFQRELGVATNILTERLKTLVEVGLLERSRYSERPPRYEYRMTDAAHELVPAFLLFKDWGDRHLRGPEGPAAALIHKPCGHRLAPELVCSYCREAVDTAELGIEWLRDPD